MKRARIVFPVLCLALGAGAAGWIALHGRSASERGAAPRAAPAVAAVRQAAELVAPASEGERALLERVALASAAEGVRPPEVAPPPETVLEVHLGEGVGLGIKLLADEAPFLKDGKRSWTPASRTGSMSASLTIEGQGPSIHVGPSTSMEGIDALAGSGLAGQRSVTFSCADHGIYALTGVRPGVALTLVVIGVDGPTALERRVPSLAAGERRLVDFAAAFPTRRLAGRVVSSEGQPVSGADISAVQGWSVSVGSRTDGQGHFSLEGFTTDRVRLTAEHEGYATLVLAEQPMTDELIELVLERGRTVRVLAHGPDGSLVPGAIVRLCTGDAVLKMKPGTTETMVFEHASCEELALFVTVAGRLFQRSIPAGSELEEVDVLVPAWQSCTVRFVGAPVPRGLYVELAGSEDKLRKYVSEPSDTEVRFEVVFTGRYEVHAGKRAGGEDTLRSETVPLEVTQDAPASLTLELRAP